MSIIALLLANGFFYVCIIGVYPSPHHSFFLGNDWRLTLVFTRHARVTRHTHYRNHQSGANHRFPTEYLCRQYSIYLEHHKYQAIRSSFLLAALRDQVPNYHLRSHRCIDCMVCLYRTLPSLIASSSLIVLSSQEQKANNSASQLLCVIFNCIPVHAVWDITITDAKCIAIRDIYLGGSVTNVILDLLIVSMPIPHVWRLHAPLAQRIVLAGMFALGTFIAVVSLVRLIIFLQIPIATQGDVTYNFREIIVWSIVEINIGLTCACLPSLKPAFQMIGLNKLFSFASSRPSDMRSPGPSSQGALDNSKSSGRPRKKGATGGLFSTLAGMSRMDDEEECKFAGDDGQAKHNVEIEMGRVSDDSAQRTATGGISVQKNWSVLVDDRKVGPR
jgi:hypothetical protein